MSSCANRWEIRPAASQTSDGGVAATGPGAPRAAGGRVRRSFLRRVLGHGLMLGHTR